MTDLNVGRKFNKLIAEHPITFKELYEISKVICKFVSKTRITDVKKYFFVDSNEEYPRLPHTF